MWEAGRKQSCFLCLTPGHQEPSGLTLQQNPCLLYIPGTLVCGVGGCFAPLSWGVPFQAWSPAPPACKLLPLSSNWQVQGTRGSWQGWQSSLALSATRDFLVWRRGREHWLLLPSPLGLVWEESEAARQRTQPASHSWDSSVRSRQQACSTVASSWLLVPQSWVDGAAPQSPLCPSHTRVPRVWGTGQGKLEVIPLLSSPLPSVCGRGWTSCPSPCTFSRLGWTWSYERVVFPPTVPWEELSWEKSVQCSFFQEKLSWDQLLLGFLVQEKECECLYTFVFFQNSDSPSRNWAFVCGLEWNLLSTRITGISILCRLTTFASHRRKKLE